MSESGMFRQAIEAIESNQRVRARDLLTRLIKSDKKNVEYWLWLSSIVESEKERAYCLQAALRLDPENQTAINGLRLLGEISANDTIEPVPPRRRAWDVDLKEDELAPRGFARVWANPILRLLFILASGVLVAGLFMLVIFGRGTIFGPRLTITPIAWTPTSSATASFTPDLPTTTSAPATPRPLWMSLDATYTPQPLFVNTPHPRSEAFRIAMRAYEKGDYESVISFLEQVQREVQEAPDVFYYLGEAQRLLGNYEEAMQAYQQALEYDPYFSAAYLGRALVQQAEDPDANIAADLQEAIALSPDFVDAHLEFASYQLAHGSPEAALEVLQYAQELLVDYHRYYLIRAQAQIELGQKIAALESAIMANEMDITDLQGYLVLAEAHMENGNFDQALEALETYGLYREGDAHYLALKGRSLYEIGDSYDDALAVLDDAIALDDQIADAYHYRGLTALMLGKNTQALNDLVIARNLAPGTFDISLALARAFWAVENLNDAYLQINATEDLARSDEELSQVYYYRAQIAHELSQFAQEELDWQALLDLPEGAVSQDWLKEADLVLNPPTETPTFTITFTPTKTFTVTPTFTPTATFTLTPSYTPTATYTITPSYTPTPTFTITPSPTPTATATPTLTPSLTPSPTVTP